MDISFCRQCDYIMEIDGNLECVLQSADIASFNTCPVEPDLKEFSIYWDDLTPETQQRIKKELGVEYVKNAQWTMFPIVVINVEDEEDEEEEEDDMDISQSQEFMDALFQARKEAERTDWQKEEGDEETLHKMLRSGMTFSEIKAWQEKGKTD